MPLGDTVNIAYGARVVCIPVQRDRAEVVGLEVVVCGQREQIELRTVELLAQERVAVPCETRAYFNETRTSVAHLQLQVKGTSSQFRGSHDLLRIRGEFREPRVAMRHQQCFRIDVVPAI